MSRPQTHGSKGQRSISTETNGVRRTFVGNVYVAKDGKREFRVYRIYGDVTDGEALAEAAQEIAIAAECERVLMQL